MPQRKTRAAPPAAAAERVGPYELAELLRRDRLGEVWTGEGPEGRVRIRILPAVEDAERVTGVLDAVAALSHPAVAPVLDQLVNPEGRVAVVTPHDRWTLADRRRAARLDAATIGPLGCVLLDGLATLHAAGIGHGAVSPATVGIDPEGMPRWEDAGLLAAVSGSRMAPALRRTADVVDCAAMLRDLGRLPAELEAVLDPVASGMPGAPSEAAPLAEAWREALAGLELPVPPPGVRARLPGLPAAEKPAGRGGRALLRRRRIVLPGWTRPVALAGLFAIALGVVPAAALGPGGAPATDRIDAYAPLRKGMELVYRVSGSGLDATVTLKVTDVRTIAGDLTASLSSQSSLQSGDVSLPLGLGGSTMRVHGDSLVRTVSGGSVRDLLAPLAPGTSWHDRRSGVISVQTIDEQRTVLGPGRLRVGAGAYERCLAVGLRSTTTLPGNQSFTGTGTLWFCPGVGLARAHLDASGQPLDVELVAVH